MLNLVRLVLNVYMSLHSDHASGKGYLWDRDGGGPPVCNTSPNFERTSQVVRSGRKSRPGHNERLICSKHFKPIFYYDGPYSRHKSVYMVRLYYNIKNRIPEFCMIETQSYGCLKVTISCCFRHGCEPNCQTGPWQKGTPPTDHMPA